MPTTAWKTAGTVVSIREDGTVSSHVWTNPTNAQGAADGSGATQAWTNAGGFPGGDTDEYLKATNFPVTTSDVPVGALIQGIEARIIRQKTHVGSGTFKDFNLRTYKGGVIGGTNNADLVTDWPLTWTAKSYGSASDLWGQAWADTDVRDATFGLGLRVQGNPAVGAPGNREDGFVDSFEIRITYAAPPYAGSIVESSANYGGSIAVTFPSQGTIQ